MQNGPGKASSKSHNLVPNTSAIGVGVNVPPHKKKVSGPQDILAFQGNTSGVTGTPDSFFNNSSLMVKQVKPDLVGAHALPTRTKQRRLARRALVAIVLSAFLAGAACGYHIKGVDLWRYLLLGVA